MRNSGRRLSPSALLFALCAVPSAASVTGVCPDGSIYIVQHESQVPCARSKQMEPAEVPPMRPEYLPKPYTWRVWNEQNDPNNPYNVVDQARKVRELTAGASAEAAAAAGVVAPSPPRAVESAQPIAESEPAPRGEVGPVDLGLGAQDLSDLFAIVELSQERSPAAFERATAGGEGVSRVAFARSRAFEEQLLGAMASRGGLAGEQVLLFAARSSQPQEFYPNFTLVQSHVTFAPDASSERQLGVLQGHLGQQGAGEVVLGYIVVPSSIDLAQELEIYWDDRHAKVLF
jgi:hypothetical protein